MTAVLGSGMSSMSDSWISWKPRIEEPSKPKPSSNTSAVRAVGGHREVLHEAGKVDEPDVDDLDALVLHQAKHLRRGPLLHGSSFVVVLGRAARAASGGVGSREAAPPAGLARPRRAGHHGGGWPPAHKSAGRD